MSSLAEYLKRYTNNGTAGTGDSDKKKKKKKRKQEAEAGVAGVVIMDDDVKWQKDAKEEVEDEEPDDTPQVEEDVEVKRMQRMEQAKAHRPYLSIGEDGSGWVIVKEEKEDEDLSPPRRGPQSSFKRTPPRRSRHDSPELNQGGSDRATPDLSPPRRDRTQPPSRSRHGSPGTNPTQMRSHDSPDRFPSPDLSPPRRRRYDSPDISPPRKSRKLSPDSSRQNMQSGPPTRADIGNTSSPARGKNVHDGDLSPPRKQPKGQSQFSGISTERSKKMSDGTIAGLRTGKEVTAEMEQKRRSDVARFKQLDATVTGRGAETVYRDKQGRKSNLDQIMEENKATQRKVLPPPVWGKGLAQHRAHEMEASEIAAEASRPFGQRDEQQLDKQLREQVRWGDPMAHLVKHKEAEFVLSDLGASEAMQESGFKIPQDVPPHSWLKRRTNAPPNRFGIRPGRHWDGVDRSTGFERDMFKHKNEKKATDTEAYLWSISDM